MVDDSLYVVRNHGVAGRPLTIMIHGAMDRHNSFRRVARRLENERIVIYDRRGYGKSGRAGATCDFAKHVADLMLIADGEPAVLIGHSMGGLVALHAAAVFPKRVLAVGAFEAPAPWKDWWPRSWVPDPDETDEDVVRNFHERVIGPGSWARLASTLRAQYEQEGHALRNDLGVGLHRPLFDPIDVVAPVTMAHGSESTDAHIRATSEFAEALPDSKLIVIEGAQHGAHRSHPDAFAEFVLESIRRVEG